MELDLTKYRHNRMKNTLTTVGIVVLIVLLLLSFWQIHILSKKYEKALLWQNEQIDSRIKILEQKSDSLHAVTIMYIDSLNARKNSSIRIKRRKNIKRLKNETKKDIFRAASHDSLYDFLTR